MLKIHTTYLIDLLIQVNIGYRYPGTFRAQFISKQSVHE